MSKAQPKKRRRRVTGQNAAPLRIARAGDIDDGTLALSEIGRLRADIQVLASLFRAFQGEFKTRLDSVVDGQRDINSAITQVLRELTSFERRIDAIERGRANGAHPTGEEH